jgi:hypothetical protein
MTMRSRFFLVITEPGREEARVEDLGLDVDEATRIYRERERAITAEPGAEVVLLSSQSEQVLRRTHSSYFGAGRALGEVLGTGS